jgi:hypothetical protein
MRTPTHLARGHLRRHAACFTRHMTTQRVILLLGIRIATIGAIIAAISGCSSDREGGGVPADAPDSACELVGGSTVSSGATFDGIDYRVTGGFTGQGDGTSLQIARDGAFTRRTKQGDTNQGQLDATALGDLVDMARAAQLPTLCARYPCSGCGDDFVYDVSVRFAGSTYRVEVSSFAPPVPARLQAVIEALQDIVAAPLP